MCVCVCVVCFVLCRTLLQLCPDAFRWYTGEAVDSDSDEEKVPEDDDDEYDDAPEEVEEDLEGAGMRGPCC